MVLRTLKTAPPGEDDWGQDAQTAVANSREPCSRIAQHARWQQAVEDETGRQRDGPLTSDRRNAFRRMVTVGLAVGLVFGLAFGLALGLEIVLTVEDVARIAAAEADVSA
jgi:hypothetical protein